MKAYTFLTIIFVTIYTVNSFAHWKSPPSVHKDYPNKCYVESAKDGYAVGTHTPAGKCMEITCHEDFSYDTLTCGVPINMMPGFTNEIDYSKPWPDCCFKLAWG